MSKTKPPRENVFQDGPFLQTAAICEKVIEEKDGVKTLVRMIDRTIVTATIVGEGGAATLPPLLLDCCFVLRLKKGNAEPKNQLRLEFRNPDGAIRQRFEHTLYLEGEPDRGFDFVLAMKMKLEQEGVYWIDVYLNEALLTKVPFRVVLIIQRQAPGQKSLPVQ